MERGHIFNRWAENQEVYQWDMNKKEIGDRVLIIDFSSVTHLNGLPLDIDDPEMQFSDNHFIVIDNRLKVKYKFIPDDDEVESLTNLAKLSELNFPDGYPFGRVYTQDLIIVNPRSNVQYRVNSGHVTIKDK